MAVSPSGDNLNIPQNFDTLCPSPLMGSELKPMNIDFDTFLHSENPIDEDKIKSIIAVTKNWLKYGGDFYSHLTGKAPLLEKGVDYLLRFDRISSGEIDMESYKKVREIKISAWLNQNNNDLCIKETKLFHSQNKDKISYQPETIIQARPDISAGPKLRYTTNYFCENNWLYFETNNFDKGQMRYVQPERESTSYRVYFSTNAAHIFSSFQDIIGTLSTSAELKRFGFQIKMADLSAAGPNEIFQIMNQKDQIVLYLGKQGIRAAFPLIQKYAQDNRENFSGPGVLLAQSLIDSRGQPIPGITLTSAAKGKSPDPSCLNKEYKTFNDMQSLIIESSLRSIVGALKDPETMLPITAKFSDVRWQMERISPLSSTQDYLGVILAQNDGDIFLTKYLMQVYPQWATIYGLRKDNTAFKVS
jgi:hypothetical protein